MDFSKVNLNLLRALQALLTRKHVTDAGKQIGLSQSAMSIALKQLREIYHDDILVRGIGRNMQLTPLGKTLVGPVNETMRMVDDVFAGQKPFLPQQDSRTFHICMTDLPSFILLPKLIDRLHQEAPNVKITVHHPQSFATREIFEPGDIDLLVGFFEGVPENLKTQILFRDEAVIAMRKHHPVLKNGKLNVDSFSQYPMIQFVNSGASYSSAIGKNITHTGFEDGVTVRVPHGITALLAVMTTDYLTLTIKKLAKSLSQHIDISMAEPPFEATPYVCRQYWHQQDNNDPAHKWLRKLIKEIADTIQ